MTIGSEVTRGGKKKFYLNFFATRRTTGEQYRRRAIPLTNSEFRELYWKLLNNAKSQDLRTALSVRGEL